MNDYLRTRLIHVREDAIYWSGHYAREAEKAETARETQTDDFLRGLDSGLMLAHSYSVATLEQMIERLDTILGSR